MWEKIRQNWLLVAVILFAEVGIGILLYVWMTPSSPDIEIAEPEPGTDEPLQPRAIFDKLEPIVINPVGLDKTHFLIVRPVLLVDSDGTISEIGSRLSMVNDAIISVMSKKRPEELNDAEKLKAIKADLAVALNRVLRNGKVLEVEFADLLIQ